MSIRVRPRRAVQAENREHRSGAEAEVKDAARLDLLGQERKVM